MVHDARDTNDISPEIESAVLDFSRAAQEIMSSTASNYDLSRLYLGSSLAGLAVILSLVASAGAISRSGGAGLFLLFIVVSYSMMMFASSYVEEEQQFWYWILTGWIFYLHTKS
jgi:ethanolaminephosphotransferase